MEERMQEVFIKLNDPSKMIYNTFLLLIFAGHGQQVMDKKRDKTLMQCGIDIYGDRINLERKIMNFKALNNLTMLTIY